MSLKALETKVEGAGRMGGSARLAEGRMGKKWGSALPSPTSADLGLALEKLL